jgi:hypothetical protein
MEAGDAEPTQFRNCRTTTAHACIRPVLATPPLSGAEQSVRAINFGKNSACDNNLGRVGRNCPPRALELVTTDLPNLAVTIMANSVTQNSRC